MASIYDGPVNREKLLVEGVKQAEAYRYDKVVMRKVAHAIGLASGTCVAHFKHARTFRNEVALRAIADGNLTVIAQLMFDRSDLVEKIPRKLQIEAMHALLRRHKMENVKWHTK